MDPKVLTQAGSEENLNIHVDHIAICVHSMVNARHHASQLGNARQLGFT